RETLEDRRIFVELREPKRVAVGAQAKTLYHVQPSAVIETVVHERARRQMRGIDDERVAFPTADRMAGPRMRSGLVGMPAAIEKYDAIEIVVLHLEYDELVALIDLHRKRCLHEERRRRCVAGVLASELGLVIVGADLGDGLGRELEPRELARAGIVDEHGRVRQLVDERLARRLAFVL